MEAKEERVIRKGMEEERKVYTESCVAFKTSVGTFFPVKLWDNNLWSGIQNGAFSRIAVLYRVRVR